MACIGLHCPEIQASVVTGYSHLRWQDSHDDGHLNLLYNIINGVILYNRGRGETEFNFQSVKHPVKFFKGKTLS